MSYSSSRSAAGTELAEISEEHCPNCGGDLQGGEYAEQDCTTCWWDSSDTSLSLPPGVYGEDLSMVEARTYVAREPRD